MTDGIALIAQLLTAQPRLKEDFDKLAELATGKLSKKGEPGLSTGGKKSAVAKKKEDLPVTALKNTKLNNVKRIGKKCGTRIALSFQPATLISDTAGPSKSSKRSS